MKQIKLFSILMMLVLCCGTVFAQGITITGTITDAKTSESLPGARGCVKTLAQPFFMRKAQTFTSPGFV
ncbi:hypothetical protein, partial [Parabacteroides goldsteinii]